jgi:inositol phosphorylceramide mannosyltransferase catalytic subunit
MIPRLIHQTAKTADLPEDLRVYQGKVRSLHPDWAYKLWTDADNLALMREELAEYLDTYTRLPKNIMRADMIRYAILYRRGGLYLDTDYEMLKPYDLLNYGCVLPVETPGDFGPGKRIGNAIMASSPGHPFFKAVLDQLRANPPVTIDPHDGGRSVLTTTGPHFISDVLRRLNGREQMDIFLPDKELFHPNTPRNPGEYQAILSRGTAYGVHHCAGSWREYTLGQRIRQKVSTLVRRFT